MSVIPIDFNRRPALRGTKRPGAWHDFAHSLARRADISRARELMAQRKLPRHVNLARLRVRSKVFS
ncbi:MAG TPA: hypothetical protein VH985_08355 [Candidatus Binatia bacterium]